MKKILYLHQYFNTPEMAGGTRSYEFARRLVQTGHEVHVVTSWRNGGKKNGWFETIEEGVHVHWLPVDYSNHMSYARRILAFFKFALSASSKAAAIKSDVIFATSTPLTIAVPAVWAKFIQRSPIIFEVRDLWPELPIAMGALQNPLLRFGAKSLEVFAYRNSKAIVALSPGMKEGIIKAGYPASRIGVIPNSSDLEFFDVEIQAGQDFRSKRPWLGDSPFILYAGTFGVINGVSYMVEMASALAEIGSSLKILLIGDGAEFELVREKAKEKGVLDGNLFIEQQIPKSEIPSALSASTLAASLFIDKPEMRSNSANKFFDALAAGKPLVLNYGGWMYKLVEESGCGINGWNVPIFEFAKQLDNRSKDYDWIKKASLASRKLALEDFDRNILAAQLELILVEANSNKSINAEAIAPGVFGLDNK